MCGESWLSDKTPKFLHGLQVAVCLTCTWMLFFCVTLVDYRVQPLVMLVKKWAKKHDINDASCGTLSSYALTLMVLHYLQGEIVIKCCPVFFF